MTRVSRPPLQLVPHDPAELLLPLCSQRNRSICIPVLRVDVLHASLLQAQLRGSPLLEILGLLFFLQKEYSDGKVVNCRARLFLLLSRCSLPVDHHRLLLALLLELLLLRASLPAIELQSLLQCALLLEQMQPLLLLLLLQRWRGWPQSCILLRLPRGHVQPLVSRADVCMELYDYRQDGAPWAALARA